VKAVCERSRKDVERELLNESDAIVLYKMTGVLMLRSGDRQPRPRITANRVFPRTTLAH
jgi:hypothetical protein